MTDIEVRVTDSSGDLVDVFTASDSGVADDRIAKLTAKFARCEPGETLTIQRSDQAA